MTLTKENKWTVNSRPEVTLLCLFIMSCLVEENGCVLFLVRKKFTKQNSLYSEKFGWNTL